MELSFALRQASNARCNGRRAAQPNSPVQACLEAGASRTLEALRC
jgi:hypothetical protein